MVTGRRHVRSDDDDSWSAGQIGIPRAVRRDDVGPVTAGLRILLAQMPGTRARCDLDAVCAPTAATLDVLARLCVAARRSGVTIEFRGAGAALRELVALAGLSDVIRVRDDLRVEPGRQTEQREESLGLEVEDDPADPVAGQLEDLE